MICVIDYDGGNINSLSNILNRLRINYVISKKQSDIENSSKIILPGVSNFSYCMDQIKKYDIDKYLKVQIFDKKKPFLGICSGMQILSNYSEEGDVKGLGFINAQIIKFKSSPKHRVPHVGWNRVYHKNNKIFNDIKNGSRFYFCHSYFMKSQDPSINFANTNYEVDFISAFNIDNIYAVQFHPEKSFDNGMKLINNFNNI